MSKFLPEEIIREYDIRGIVGKTLFNETAELLGKAIGSRALTEGEGKVVFAYDGRLTSKELADNLILGLKASGCKITNIGCGPSPMLYYAAKEYGYDYGIMITGSHNPPEYNGFKLVAKNKQIYGEEIKKIAAEIKVGKFQQGEGKLEHIDYSDQYCERLLNDLQISKKLKIAWDPANGAGADILQKLIKKIPGEHFVINADIDGNFPNHHPDPTIPENLMQLQKLVKDNQCDLGISFDGDADRIGAVAADGEIIFGDQLLIIYAKEILANCKNAKIIADIKASNNFVSEVTKAGGDAIIWKTGHSLIKAKMLETEAKLAGEMSGHIFFNDIYYGFDDALYASIRLINILSCKEQSLAEFKNSLPVSFTTPEIRIDCAESKKFEIIKEIKDYFIKNSIKHNAIDGIRVDYADSWFLIRASNTSACIVVRCEANSQEKLDLIKTEVKNYLKDYELKLDVI